MILDVNEIIQLQITTIKKILKIKQDIIFTTDIKIWKQDSTIIGHKSEDVYAYVDIDYSYVFINLKKITTVKMLYKAIYHELLHIRYPKASESRIQTLEKRYLF